MIPNLLLVYGGPVDQPSLNFYPTRSVKEKADNYGRMQPRGEKDVHYRKHHKLLQQP